MTATCGCLLMLAGRLSALTPDRALVRARNVMATGPTVHGVIDASSMGIRVTALRTSRIAGGLGGSARRGRMPGADRPAAAA